MSLHCGAPSRRPTMVPTCTTCTPGATAPRATLHEAPPWPSPSSTCSRSASGPSSSHTVGPMRAARAVRAAAAADGLLARTARVRGRAVRLARRHRQGPRQRQGGAAGPGRARARHGRRRQPSPALLGAIRSERPPAAARRPRRSPSTRRRDLVFQRREPLPFHPNGMRFTRLRRRRRRARAAASTTRSAAASSSATRSRPTARSRKAIAPTPPCCRCPFHSGDDLLRASRSASGCSIAQVMRAQRTPWRSDAEIDAGLLKIWEVMQACVAARLPHRRRPARRLQGQAPRRRAVPRS